MTLENALDYFKKLGSETDKKSELKVYRAFIRIITSLQRKNLPETDIHAIEAKLDSLELITPTANKKKYYRKAQHRLETYLKDTFSLIPKGYYTNLGTGLGASFGIVFGIAVLSSFESSLGIALGIAFGMLIGLIIGRNLDAQAMASGKMI